MRFRSLLPLAVFLASTLPIAPAAFAAEGKEKVVKLEDIPAPARATILKEAKGAPILKVETEDRKGQTLYEAHVKRGKDEIGILVDAKGKLIGTHSEKDEKNEK